MSFIHITHFQRLLVARVSFKFRFYWQIVALQGPGPRTLAYGECGPGTRIYMPQQLPARGHSGHWAAAEPVDSSSVLEAKVSAMGGLMSTAHFVIAPSRKFGVTVRGNGTLWIGK